MMLLNRPLQMLAVAAGAGSMMLAMLSSAAVAQRPQYRNVSQGNVTLCQSAHGCCPCPPSGGYDSGAVIDGPAPVEGTDPMAVDNDLPEVADLGGGGDFASAPQSAVPNAIGDSMGGCFTIMGSIPTSIYTVCPSGRRFKIAENNSALPQHRVYYNYNYFDNAQLVSNGVNANRLNVQRHQFGFEVPFWCNMASFGVEVPFYNGANSNFNGANSVTDTEFGNISLYVKNVLYQDCCKTVTAGLGVDLPTAEDVNITDANGTFALNNDVVILSPYLAVLMADPCGNSFLHAFAQMDFATDDFGVNVVGTPGQADAGTLLHLDASYGYWLNRDCCGNGVAAIFELHYTTNIEGRQVIGAGNTLTSSDNDLYNATVGVNIARNCWDVRPAVVLPLLNRPDRGFDWEFALQVNRRF